MEPSSFSEAQKRQTRARGARARPARARAASPGAGSTLPSGSAGSCAQHPAGRGRGGCPPRFFGLWKGAQNILPLPKACDSLSREGGEGPQVRPCGRPNIAAVFSAGSGPRGLREEAGGKVLQLEAGGRASFPPEGSLLRPGWKPPDGLPGLPAPAWQWGSPSHAETLCKASPNLHRQLLKRLFDRLNKNQC